MDRLGVVPISVATDSAAAAAAVVVVVVVAVVVVVVVAAVRVVSGPGTGSEVT